MRVDKTIPYCVAIFVLLVAGTSAAEDDYIISKADDKHLLTLSIAFVALCAVFLLVSIVTTIWLLKKVNKSGPGYDIEEKEENHQSMNAGKSNGESMYEPPPDQYETLKMNESNNGVYQSNDPGQPEGEPKTKRGTPPGTEKGQKDSKESEKQKTLSSFQNPAYESHSISHGLDKHVEFKPATSGDAKEDTEL